MIYYSV